MQSQVRMPSSIPYVLLEILIDMLLFLMWHLNSENELKTENDRNFANLVGPNFTKKYNANKIIKHIHQQMTNILIFASY